MNISPKLESLIKLTENFEIITIRKQDYKNYRYLRISTTTTTTTTVLYCSIWSQVELYARTIIYLYGIFNDYKRVSCGQQTIRLIMIALLSPNEIILRQGLTMN